MRRRKTVEAGLGRNKNSMRREGAKARRKTRRKQNSLPVFFAFCFALSRLRGVFGLEIRPPLVEFLSIVPL
jgi:hypothetical protein